MNERHVLGCELADSWKELFTYLNKRINNGSASRFSLSGILIKHLLECLDLLSSRDNVCFSNRIKCVFSYI